MSETFLITGGQGFIGAWIARLLLDEGTPFVIYDRSPDNSILSQVIEPGRLVDIDRVFGDIADTGKVAHTVIGHGITHIIHLAGLQVPTCREQPVLGARVNVIGMLNVLEAVRHSAGQVAMTVYASSAAIAGEVGDYDGPIGDDTPHQPRTHYGIFKAANEGSARVYYEDHGIPSVGLRPYTVYGVGREVGITSGPTKAIKAAVLGRHFDIPFTGPSSFVYAEDLAKIFVQAARSGNDGAVALNIRGTVETVENFVQLLEEFEPDSRGHISTSGKPLPIAYDMEETGLENLLGSDGVPRTSLREGIEQTIDQFRDLAQSGRLQEREV